MQKIVDNRVECNDDLCDHSTVQCGDYTVGFLGIVNGMCGTIQQGLREGWGKIAALYDDDGKLVAFERVNES